MGFNTDMKIRGKYLSTHFKDFQSLDVTEEEIRNYEYTLGEVLPMDANARILEIGTGLGKFLHFLKRHGYERIEGIDVSGEMVKWARKNSGIKVRLVRDVGRFLRSKQNTYDCVAMLDVLEHIEKARVVQTLEAVRLSLKPGGTLILSTENMASPIGRIQQYLDFSHEYNYTEVTLRQVLATAGFCDITIWGIPEKFRMRPRRIAGLMLRWLWFRLLRFLHELERPGGVIPTIYSKELYATCRPDPQA